MLPVVLLCLWMALNVWPCPSAQSEHVPIPFSSFTRFMFKPYEAKSILERKEIWSTIEDIHRPSSSSTEPMEVGPLESTFAATGNSCDHGGWSVHVVITLVELFSHNATWGSGYRDPSSTGSTCGVWVCRGRTYAQEGWIWRCINVFWSLYRGGLFFQQWHCKGMHKDWGPDHSWYSTVQQWPQQQPPKAMQGERCFGQSPESSSHNCFGDSY